MCVRFSGVQFPLRTALVGDRILAEQSEGSAPGAGGTCRVRTAMNFVPSAVGPHVHMLRGVSTTSPSPDLRVPGPEVRDQPQCNKTHSEGSEDELTFP